MECFRTHNCGELRLADVGKKITLSGWVHRKRDHGSILFFDLRDRYGLIQLVFDESVDSNLFKAVSKVRLESVIRVNGSVLARDDETVNKTVDTGEVEICVSELFVESEAAQLPFSIAVDSDYPDSLRFEYRYLDLRREKPFQNILKRSEVISHMRLKMQELGFIEVQTPILTASSPEGARDYIVPSRLHVGKFYALPQAPQQFKQLLMVAGFDKYFQIAPCFRDEDARADRAVGDFYQLDIEMSFVTQAEIFKIIQGLMIDIFSKFSTKNVVQDFPIITYDNALLRYASDKPDLRNPIVISDVTEAFKDSNFNLFASAIAKGMCVRAIPATKCGKKSRGFFDKTLNYARSVGAKGLAYITFENGIAGGPIAKFLNKERIDSIVESCNLQPDDAVFFSSAPMEEMLRILNGVRQFLGKELSIINEDVFNFCWIVDFPYFELDKNNKLEFSHNPFSMPKSDLDATDVSELLKIRAYQYDLVCNGIELSSGAVRNHKVDLLYKAFSLVGYSKDDVNQKFPALTSAFQYGVPPHAGIAPGIDRIVMLLTNESNVREVICFPFSQTGEDLMMKAPSLISDASLKELGLKPTAFLKESGLKK